MYLSAHDEFPSFLGADDFDVPMLTAIEPFISPVPPPPKAVPFAPTKFVTSRIDLINALEPVALVCRNGSGIFAECRLYTDFNDDNMMWLEATDFETSVRVSLFGIGPIQETICNPKMLLAALGKPSKYDTAIVTLTRNENDIMIQADGSVSRIPVTCHPSDYHKIPNAFVDKTNAIEIHSDDLLNAICRVEDCISNDYSRPNLNGISIQSVSTNEKTSVHFVATDGSRLAFTETAFVGLADMFNKGVIVHRTGLAMLKQLCARSSVVWLSLQDNFILYTSAANVTATIRPIDEPYPDYHRVIPAEFPMKVTLSKAQLQAALKKVKPFISKGYHRCSIHCGDGAGLFDVEVDNPEKGTFQSSFAVANDAPNIIGLYNWHFLSSMADSLPGDTLTMEWIGPNDHTRWSGNDDSFFIIMPLRA